MQKYFYTNRITFCLSTSSVTKSYELQYVEVVLKKSEYSNEILSAKSGLWKLIAYLQYIDISVIHNSVYKC